jgi:HEAT repeat protein
VSAEAVSILDRELPQERAQALLESAWSIRCFKTALACVEVLGRSGAADIGLLAEVLTRSQDVDSYWRRQNVELAYAAVRYLEATGSPDAEPPLIQALQHTEAEIQVAAANVLGRIGSAAAVLPLQELAGRSLIDPELRHAARQAIGQIQSRLPGASPGQLSLAGAEVGQLSLAEAEAGQLSLANDPGGQLSLPAGEAGQISLSDEEERRKPGPRGAA